MGVHITSLNHLKKNWWAEQCIIMIHLCGSCDVHETPVTGNTVWLIFTRFVSNLTESGNLRASVQTDCQRLCSNMACGSSPSCTISCRISAWSVHNLSLGNKKVAEITTVLWNLGLLGVLIKSPIMTKYSVPVLCSFALNFSSIG